MDVTTTPAPEAQAQDSMCMAPEPSAEHKWLQRLVGEWTCESQMTMPDGTSMNGAATESVRSLGGLWTIGEMTTTMPGSDKPDYMIMTLGFDPARGKFVGSFVGSMMTFMWIYEGTLAGDTLTLDCVGPNMAPGAEPGATANYQDIVTLVDDNTRTLRSQMQLPDGSWAQFMTATYRRVG
jgi:hypothetical protein